MKNYALTLIIPTLNEVGNVNLLYQRVSKVLIKDKFEILFVDDDSTDGTLDAIKNLAVKHDNVRFISRINTRGISSAFIDGVASSNATYIALMDADLQHDETLLHTMLSRLKTKKLDIIIGSRFKDESKTEGLSKSRERLSRLGNTLSNKASGAKLTDPLSGFFMMRKDTIDKILHQLSGIGFKILLDIFATCNSANIKLKYEEIGMIFKPRISGESKLDTMVMIEFMILIFDKMFGRLIPARFILFMLVGFSGLFIHACSLILCMKMLNFNFNFIVGQTLSTIVAMTNNFFLNNMLTYRDKRLKGLRDIAKGLVSFCLACSIGALVNVVAADFLYIRGIHWLVAGILGGMVGAIWNYGITSYFTWGKKRNDTQK